jgi:hypothetical protein
VISILGLHVRYCEEIGAVLEQNMNIFGVGHSDADVPAANGVEKARRPHM